MARLDAFLKVVVEQSASDLHLSSGAPAAIRKDGELVPLPFRVLSEQETKNLLLEVLTLDERDAFEANQTLDFLYEIKNVARFRGNLFVHARGIGSVFRVIPSTVPTLDGLQLPPVIRTVANMRSGMVLLCGATGSGKTTTLAAILHEINKTRCANIITIEDPVEFVHPALQSVVSQRQAGVHTKGFAAAAKAALRESPDVLVVGEMRDYEAIGFALSASAGGALVLGTLHASSAAKAAHRIIDTFPPDQAAQALHMFSSQFQAIIAQHLIRRATGEGRMAVLEVLLRTPATAQLLKDGKVHQIESYLESGDHEGEGMLGLDNAIVMAVKSGAVTLQDALPYANREERVMELLGAGAAAAGVRAP
jgi:twitching motility protein PilT